MSKKLNENPDCTSENDLKTLSQIQDKYEATLGSFREPFKTILENIKKGETEPSTLEKFRKDFQSNNYFGDDFRYKELLKLSHFENRFRLQRQLKEDHIQYLGRENDDVSFNKLFTKISNEFTSVYVLYYKQSWVEDHGDIWRTSSQTFYSKLKESNNSIVRNGFVVDCEFSHPYCDNMTQSAIHEYKNGRITSTDFVLKVEQEEFSINTKIEEILGEILFIKENFESKTNCSRNKCFNGGSCINTNAGFSCACPPGFQGKQCDKQINFCESSPCQNNGFCQNELNGYKCLCSKGFSGTNCATSINECSSGPSPCQNGGHCIDEKDGFTCACRLPWTGQRCQAQLNACKGNVCQNGGACTNTFDYWDFDCTCKPGYSGKQCEIDLDACSRNSTLCKNGGVCQNINGSYTCSCAAGFAGNNCEINSDDMRCGGTLTSDSGSINYKFDEIINQEEGCLWIVAAQRKAASHMILSLTAAGFVTNDRHFLSVGYLNNFDYKEGAFVWKRFGSVTPETIVVSTPVAFIHFVASGTEQFGTTNKGFALNFRSEYYGGFNAGYKYSNIFLTGPSGNRRYPLAGNYDNSESTAIVVQPTAQISFLNVKWWDLENGNDFVSIWILQLNFNYEKQERLTGQKVTSSKRHYNNNFSSRNDPFLLIFHSDGSTEYNGFEFSWGS